MLLVDDEPQVLRGLEAVLHTDPYVLLSCESAEAGLEILDRTPVDVVISDERMPGVSGCAFLEHVTRRFPSVTGILLTGHATVETATRAINDAHVVSLLLKPCRPDVLRAALDSAIRAARLRAATSALLDAAQPAGSAAPPDRPRPTDPRSLALRFWGETARELSVRELDVLHLIGDGRRVTEVASSLFVSEHTVRNHLKAVFRKLGIHGQDEIRNRYRSRGSHPRPV